MAKLTKKKRNNAGRTVAVAADDGAPAAIRATRSGTRKRTRGRNAQRCIVVDRGQARHLADAVKLAEDELVEIGGWLKSRKRTRDLAHVIDHLRHLKALRIIVDPRNSSELRGLGHPHVGPMLRARHKGGGEVLLYPSNENPTVSSARLERDAAGFFVFDFPGAKARRRQRLTACEVFYGEDGKPLLRRFLHAAG